MSEKKWYLSKTIWLAVLQAILGVFVAIGTEIPTVGWIMVVKSVIDVLIRSLTEESVKV